ncbi:hypothetical protein [Wenyingzhuangia sp. IMCC45574]
MKIEEIFELVDRNLIDNKFDKSISERILSAEQDWDYEIESLNEFIEILEQEIGAETTKQNLEKLLETYNQEKSNSWKSESICYLLEIFNYTGYSNLRKVFESLSEKLLKKTKLLNVEIFEVKGYPSLKVYEEYFEIRAIDYSLSRKFKYYELKKIVIENIKEKWWYKLYIISSIPGMIYSKDDPIKLKIINKRNGIWEYKVSPKFNSEFRQFISVINHRIKAVANNQ